MTRKDYELIVRAVRLGVEDSSGSALGTGLLESIARAFADELVLDNPRFSRERFIEAMVRGK